MPDQPFKVGDRVIARDKPGVISEITETGWIKVEFDNDEPRAVCNYWGNWEIRREQKD